MRHLLYALCIVTITCTQNILGGWPNIHVGSWPGLNNNNPVPVPKKSNPKPPANNPPQNSNTISMATVTYTITSNSNGAPQYISVGGIQNNNGNN